MACLLVKRKYISPKYLGLNLYYILIYIYQFNRSGKGFRISTTKLNIQNNYLKNVYVLKNKTEIKLQNNLLWNF